MTGPTDERWHELGGKRRMCAEEVAKHRY